MADSNSKRVRVTARPKPKPKAKITPKPKAKARARPRPKPKAPAPEQIPDSDSGSDSDLDLDFPMLDLRKYAGMSETGGVSDNDAIIAMMDALIKHTVKVKADAATSKERGQHQRRITSFSKGRDAIKSYKKPIVSGAQAQRDIDGVGKGIATRIQEFLTTGKLAELEEAVSDEARTIMELTEVTGIGEVKARSLMEDGVTSVDDLLAKVKKGDIRVAKGQLTHHMAVGLEFFHDLKQRMPWAEAHEIATVLREVIAEHNPVLIIEVCGSYRRKKPTCGDLDVLISRPDESEGPSPLPAVVNALKKADVLIGDLTTKGQTKYMGICRGSSGVGRRIDIRYVPLESMGAATLYFTGSGKFNKIMRWHANARGYTLNEYGLYRYIDGVKGEQLPVPTEQDIFRILRFVYLKPTEREF